jgi:hypothetical protein
VPCYSGFIPPKFKGVVSSNFIFSFILMTGSFHFIKFKLKVLLGWWIDKQQSGAR